MERKGLFIVFEGIDGSGKSCQIARTKKYLEENGYAVTVTREPGGTSVGEKIRELLLDPANSGMKDGCELLLYASSRSQHVAEMIAPALEKGDAVLCDRFALSTLAYQGYGRGLSLDLIKRLNEIAVAETLPDITFVLDVPETVAEKRVSVSRGEPKDRLEQEKSDFFRKVRQGYLIEAEKDSSVAVIDGTVSEDEVFAAVTGALEPLLVSHGKRGNSDA